MSHFIDLCDDTPQIVSVLTSSLCIESESEDGIELYYERKNDKTLRNTKSVSECDTWSDEVDGIEILSTNSSPKESLLSHISSTHISSTHISSTHISSSDNSSDELEDISFLASRKNLSKKEKSFFPTRRTKIIKDIELEIAIDHSLDKTFFPFEFKHTEEVGLNCFRVLPSDLLVMICEYSELASLELSDDRMLIVYGQAQYKRKITADINRQFRMRVEDPSIQFEESHSKESEIEEKIFNWQVKERRQIILCNQAEIPNQIDILLNTLGKKSKTQTPFSHGKQPSASDSKQVFALILCDIKGITPMMAQVVSEIYTLRQLVEEYRDLDRVSGEALLENVVVKYQRVCRRIGPLLSRRIYWHFVSVDGKMKVP